MERKDALSTHFVDWRDYSALNGVGQYKKQTIKQFSLVFPYHTPSSCTWLLNCLSCTTRLSLRPFIEGLSERMSKVGLDVLQLNTGVRKLCSPIPGPFLLFTFCCCYFCLIFGSKVSWSPGRPKIFCGSETDFELLILLFLPPKFWDHRWALPLLDYHLALWAKV